MTPEEFEVFKKVMRDGFDSIKELEVQREKDLQDNIRNISVYLKTTVEWGVSDPDVLKLVESHMRSCRLEYTEGCGFLYDLSYFSQGRMLKEDLFKKYNGVQ
jgi:hypothetical protein